MYRLLRLPIRQTFTTNAFLRTYASRQTTPSLTEGEQHIFDKLTKELEPSELLVQDVSGLHLVLLSVVSFRTYQRVLWPLRDLELPSLVRRDLGGCGSFYAITVASEKLKGLPILKQHRRIKDVLKDDMAGLHGLQVRHLHPLVVYCLTKPCALVSS